MTGGFTFDGVDIEDLGLTYAPDLSNTYVYKPANVKNHEQIFDGHDGGYYYGNTLQPKEFTLRCIYEDQHVLNGILTKIYDVFRYGKTGKLVFKKRPWCWYVATVYNIDIKQMTNYQNGVISIAMKAYYPFARCDYDSIPNGSEYEEDMLHNSALLKENVFNNQLSFATASDPITEATSLLIYNPGTERAKVAVRIAGDVGDGVLIANNTTGQTCRFVGITPDMCINNKYIQCDGLNGQTTVTNGIVSQPGFLYHDYGFIELEPGYPAYRDIEVNVSTDGKSINSDKQFSPDMIGRYIYLSNGQKAKIVNVLNDSKLDIDATLTPNLRGTAQILKMNEIRVSCWPNGGSMNLTKLDFVFKPTFA